MTNEPLVQETESLESSPSLETVSETVIEPIYKHKDGRVFTKSQLIKDGLDETRIKTGLDSKMIIQIGDTEDPTQEFKHKDGRILTVKQLADDGVTADRISNGISMGLITPLEKKNQIQDVSTTSSDNLQAGASDSTTNIPTVPLTKDGVVAEVTPVSTEPTDLISQVLKMQDLKNKVGDVSVYGSTGGAAVLVAPDEKSVKEAAKIKEELKKQDINADAVYNQIKDIPKELYDWHFTKADGTVSYPYSKENLSIKIVEEPLSFSNLINNAKNRIDLQKAVNNIPETERIEKGITPISVMNEYNDLNKADNLEQYKNSNLERQKELINTYIDDLSDRKKALNRLETGAASFITPNNTDLIKEYQASPLKNQLDISQYAALEVKRIFHPDQYKQAIDFLNAPTITEISPQQKITFGKDGFSVASISQDESEESLNRKLGKETVLKNLADEGRYNAILDLQTKNERLAAASKKATTQEEADRIKQQYDANTEKINAIKADYQKDGEKYPLSSDLKYEQQVKDIQQQAGFNGAEYGVAKLATGLIKTGKAIDNLLINIFWNKQDKVLHDLASLGEYKQEQSDFYLPKKYNKDNPIVGIKVSKTLQEDLNKILKGKNVGDLSEEENNQLKEVLAQNQNQIETITDTDTEGKGANYTAYSILYSNAGMLGDIASFALQGGFLKAVGVGSALAASIPMFTTSQDDFRKEAIAKGNPDPDGYANVMSTIIGLAGMISPQLDIVKRAIGIESKAGQMLVGVSEKTWNNVIEKNKPLVDRIYNSFAHTAKEAANMGLTYGAGVPIAQGIVGKEMYNEPVSYSDIYQNAINSTEHLLVSSVALLGVGAITNFKTTTLEQKSSLWNASSNRLMSLTRIDEAVKNKEITPEQGAERKKVINTSADIIQNMPTRKANGEKMTDKERLNYFYNLVIEDNVKKQKSVLPKAQQEKLDYTTMVADHLNDLIIDPKTPEELNTRKKELEAFLTPQKDKEGKEIVLSEKDKLQAQSELEAINTHLEDKIKEQQPVPNAEEIITGKPAKPVEIKEQTVEPVSDITVSEMLDKTGKYKGEEGSFYQDGQTVVFKVAGKNKEYELGNIEEIGDSPIKDFDIEHKESVVTIGENGELIVRGEEYKNRYSNPLMAIDRDANGNVIGVTLETKNGNKRRFRGNTAEDIAYQIHLQEINKNNETAEFEEFINEPEQQQQIGDATVSIATPEVTVESTEPIQREKIEPVQTEVEKLRAEEQAELDSKIENAEQYRVDGKVDRNKIEEKKQEERKKWKYDYSKPNPIDAKYDAELKAFDEVYNKYDKLITPLLKEEKLPTPSVEAPKAEFKEPKDDTERKSLADRFRGLKSDRDKLFGGGLGVGVAVWDGAMELVAKSIEAGEVITDAIKKGIEYIEKTYKGKWDRNKFIAEVNKIAGVETKIPTSIEKTKQKDYIRDEKGNYYPTNVDLPQGFKITQNYENNEGEGVLYDQFGYRIMEGNINEIEDLLRESYPIGTPKIKDATNLDLYSNINKFTLKQLGDILQNLDAEGDWNTMVKEVDGQPNEYSAKILETSLLAESRNKLKEYVTDMLKSDKADEYIGFDIPKDGLGKTELPQPITEPKTAAERKSVADRLRSAKIKSDKLFDATIGLPIAVWNGAVELVAKSIEGGMLVADAIKRGINYIEKNHRGKWDKKAYNDKVIEALGFKGINVNGEDVIAKPMLDKQSADVINGFYSPLEQGILDTKLEKTTGKEWAKKLEGTTEGDELRFTGMSDFLAENADKTLTKQEVLDYMKNNRIEIVEISKSDEVVSGLSMEEIQDKFEEKGLTIDQQYGEVFIEDENQEPIGFEELPLELQPLAVSYGRQLGQAEFKESQTKYSEYQLPGVSSNYKEVLITLPENKSKLNENQDKQYKLEQERQALTETVKVGDTGTASDYKQRIKKSNLKRHEEISNELNKLREEEKVLRQSKEAFKSSHFDEPNILAHVRMNTRVDAEGNKVLHIEEFQSDWGQKGKKQGGFARKFKPSEVKAVTEKENPAANQSNLFWYFEVPENVLQIPKSKYATEQEARNYVLSEKTNRTGGIPEAPFVTETANWTKLAWKVAVKEAVKEGADKITWTTGEQQNERYDLSKQVNNIHVEGVENVKGVHLVDIELANGGKEYLEVENGIIREGKYEGKRLDDVIGKEYAEKVLSVPEGKTKVLKGADLKLGGSGMKGFYGSPSEGKLGIVGEVAKSLFKQEPSTTELGKYEVIGDYNRNPTFSTFAEAKKELDTNPKASKIVSKDISTQHSIDITPEIIQGVKEGMSMFKSPFQKTADFFRKGKIGNDIAMGTIPFLKEVWNGALEVAAKTAELTGDSVKAIKDAVKYIKSTDWYKSLSTSDKESMVNHFIDEHIDLLPKGKESLDLSVETEHPYLYRGSTEKRVSGLMRHMMESENVSDATKADLKRNGIDYAIANNEEARKTASEIVDAFGEEDALRIAEQTDMHPSVRSAIFAETIDRAYSREKNATTDAEKIEAAEQWKDRVNAYDKLLTAGGQFTAYVNHFYGTSPLGFVMRENENTQGRFNDWFKDKEPTYQELLDALNETAEGKTFIADEVERIVKEERKQRREKRDKNIEDFFDKAKLQGGTYLTVIPPGVWNGAMDGLKAAVKAGDRVSDAVQRAIETISAQIGNNWDKEKFRKEYEGLLAKVADGDKKEAEKQDLASVYERRKKELERRLTNKDFSAEEYKDKKTLSDKEQAAKEEYDRIKKLYDEEKKKSPEWQDKKAKQFLDKFRDRMKGLDDKQKEEVVRKSIKKLAETGALREEEFRKIVAETIGFKDLTDTQVKQIEDLTKTINSLSDVEDAMVANPNEKTIADYKKAKEDAIQAGLDLYNIVHKKSDVISTIKSLITGSLLSVPTLIKNVAQNIIMQGFIRFPREVVRQTGELGVYGTTWIGNKLLGTKMYEPTSNLLKAQKGYFKGYLEGIKRGWFNFKRGTQEQDYFGKTSYQSTLAPRQALKDLKLWRSGEKFLTKGEVADRWIRASIFARQADFILRGMGFGDRPQRFAAERAKAIQIATGELKLVGDSEILAFEQSPQKMAYKILVDAGVNKVEALQRSIEIEERIKQEGSKAVLEEENILSMTSGYIEKGLAPNKENPLGIKGVKAVGSVVKTLTFPFIKIPGNVYWQMFKLFNPEVSIGQALWHSGEALNYSKKGDNASARKSIEKAKDSMSMAFLGLGLATAATTLVSQGYIRSNPSQDDAAKVRAGQRLFGKQNQINLGRLMGGEDYWVDLAWLGPIGAELDIKNRLAEDKIKNNLKGKEEPSPFGEWWNGLEYSAAAALNQLVFDQGARTVNAMKDGQNGAKIWFVNTMNTFENIFTGATYAAISKAMLPEEPRLRGDEVTDELLNNVKQRNILVRLVLGRPPAKISMWGEPIKKDNSISGVMGNILGWEKGSANQFGSILYDDYRKTKDSRFFPPVEDNKLKIDDKDVEITQAEKDDLEVFIGKARKQLVSAFVYDSSLPYKVSVQAPDENGNMITKGEYKHYSNLTEDQKAEALTQIYKQGKETGYAQFLEKYPQYTPAKLTSKELGAQIKKEAYNEKFKFDMEKLLKNK